MGRLCMIPDTAIYPDDIFEELSDLILGGWDDVGFAIAFLEASQTKLDLARMQFPPLRRRMCLWWVIRPGISFREWLKDAVPQLTKTL